MKEKNLWVYALILIFSLVVIVSNSTIQEQIGTDFDYGFLGMILVALAIYILYTRGKE